MTTLDLAQMSREALDFCHETKAKFPTMPSKVIGRFAKFAVMSAHALRVAEDSMPAGKTLSPAGIEMVLTECGKHVFKGT